MVEIPDRRVHGFQRLVQDLVLAHHGLVEVLNDGVNLIVRQAAFHVPAIKKTIKVSSQRVKNLKFFTYFSFYSA